MHCYEISDAHWEQAKRTLFATDNYALKQKERTFVTAVVLVAKTGEPWNSIPRRLGSDRAAYTKFWKWCYQNRWKSIFRGVAMVDLEMGLLPKGFPFPDTREEKGLEVWEKRLRKSKPSMMLNEAYRSVLRAARLRTMGSANTLHM